MRPFCRRRLRTARPFLVLMRARKPWVRRREVLLGWKVRFMIEILRPESKVDPAWGPAGGSGANGKNGAEGKHAYARLSS